MNRRRTIGGLARSVARWAGRPMLVALLLGTIGCEAPTMYAPSPEWISQGAQSRSVVEWVDGPIAVYMFAGIRFVGDMRYADYLHIRHQIAPLSGGEIINWIENWEAVPSASGEEDVRVRTGYDRFVGCGHTFTFIRTQGQLELADVVTWCQ